MFIILYVYYSVGSARLNNLKKKTSQYTQEPFLKTKAMLRLF